MMNLLNTLRSLPEGGGLTLCNYESASYNDGYQVAVYGIECTTLEQAEEAIHAYKGNAGVWLSGGIYYVDKSFHVAQKHIAIRMAMYYKQLSVYVWKTDSLIWKEDYKNVLSTD